MGIFVLASRLDNPKQSVGFVNDPCVKIQLVVEKEEAPQTIEFQWLLCAMLQRAEKLHRIWVSYIIGIDLPIAKVADQQNLVIKPAKLSLSLKRVVLYENR